MPIENGYVRCVGFFSDERNFTLGNVYPVVNGTITNDNGYTHNRRHQFTDVFSDWLNHWYKFEPVNEEHNTPTCYVCGQVIENHDYIVVDNRIVCGECRESHVYECEECGRLVLEDNCQTTNNGTLICTPCFERNYRMCDCCGEYVNRYDTFITGNGETVCEYCRDEWYYECSDCGELVHTDYVCWDEDDNPYCPCCYEENVTRVIHGYHYKPIPVFYGCEQNDGYNPLYMGVELEIDNGGESHTNAGELCDLMNECEEHIYIKHDGSINNGFEIVSHPATLDYHMHYMKWFELVQLAKELGYRSHDTNTCGLHVHVSRKALGNDYVEQDATISKIIYFVENNWHSLLRFTRRTESNLSRWASRYGIEEDIPKTYKKAKNDYNRYRAINLLNDNTIEFRVFRGTLNYTTFIATLQFVDNLCRVCRESTENDISKMTWVDFVSRISAENNRELFVYLEKRGLNV